MSTSQKFSAAAAVEIAILQSANERTAIYFATSMAGLCLLIVLARFTSLSLKASSIEREGVLMRSLIKIERCAHLIQRFCSGLTRSLGFLEADCFTKSPSSLVLAMA